ncbi:MAG: hypothetical protein HRU35_02790, partial [Rickettsiaceae bacterium]|nr:hypothetical protein [Rickettsiaceae bacterium]
NSLCKKEASDLTKLDFAWYKKFAPFVNEIRELYPTKKYLPTIDNKFNECVVIKDFINNFIYETVIQYWYRIYKVSQNVDDANALILSFYLDNNTSNWDILKISFPMPFVGINAILPSNEDYVVVAKTLSKSRDTWCSYKTQDYGKFIRNFAKDEFINWFKTVIIPIILKDKKLDLSYQELDDSHIPLLAECLEFLPEGFTIELNLRGNNKITDLRPLSPGLNKVHQLAIMDDIKKLPDFSESSVVQLNMVYCKSFDSYYKFLIAISGSPIMSLSVHGNNVLFAMAHKIVDKNIKTFKNTINSLCKKEASDLTKLDFAWYKKFAPFANKILSLYPATEHLPDIDNKFNECAVINKAINDFICKTVIQYWLKEYKIQNVDDANALISEYGLNNDINNWDVLKISVPMSFVKLDAILPPNLTEDDGVNTVGDTITDQ